MLAARGSELWLAQTFAGLSTLGGSGIALTSFGGTDIVLVRLRTSDLNPDPGTELVFGGSSDERVRGLSFDADGGLWLAGETSGKFVLSGTTVGADSGTSLFLARVNVPTGATTPVVLGVLPIPATGTHSLRGIANDKSAAPIVTGEVSGSVNLGSGFISHDAGVFVGRTGP